MSELTILFSTNVNENNLYNHIIQLLKQRPLFTNEPLFLIMKMIYCYRVSTVVILNQYAMFCGALTKTVHLVLRQLQEKALCVAIKRYAMYYSMPAHRST